MKISNMAMSNIKGNLYRYIMYYLSNAFAVTVFFIFANFVFHPNADPSNITGGGREYLIEGTKSGMIASQVVIIIFTFFFVGYSTSIFLKSRGKEFGLLSLYGMTKNQIRKYVLIENIIISLMSILTGTLTGIIFSKLFFMAMESFLSISIPFHISLNALGLTFIVFLIVFQTISLYNVFKIRSKQIIEQLKESKKPKIVPKFSRFKSILGVLLITIGYLTAWFVPGGAVPLAMLPVILIVIAGTYFIFTEFSIYISNRILKNEKILYKRTNLVSYSQMIFKLQDTAKVMFLAAILGAFTFSATETIFSFYMEIPHLIGVTDTAADVSIIQRGDRLTDDVDTIIDSANLDIVNINKIDGVTVEKNISGENTRTVEYFLLSESNYNELVKEEDKSSLNIEKDELVYLYPFKVMFPQDQTDLEFADWDEIDLDTVDGSKTFNLKQQIYGQLTSLPKSGYYEVLILNDEDFKEVYDSSDYSQKIIFTGIEVENFKKSYAPSLELKDRLGEDYGREFYSKAIEYKEGIAGYGLALFIGFFIAILFLIASGSILYFKLFGEIKQDAVEYEILRKIGSTKKEINKIATKQIGIIFFLPFIVASMHAFFALKSLSSLLMTNLFIHGIIVMLGYLIFQILYFFIIRSVYIRRIN